MVYAITRQKRGKIIRDIVATFTYAIYALGEEMKKGFDSTHDMNRFAEKAERKVAEINKLVLNVK